MICSSETSVDFQRTRQRYIPEDRSLLMYLRFGRSEVLTAVNNYRWNVIFFWDVRPCSLVDSEALLNIYQITQRHIQKIQIFIIIVCVFCKPGYAFQFYLDIAQRRRQLLPSLSQSFRPEWFMRSGWWERVLLTIYVYNLVIYEMTRPNTCVRNKCSDM
jgi:hypothetical protein